MNDLFVSIFQVCEGQNEKCSLSNYILNDWRQSMRLDGFDQILTSDYEILWKYQWSFFNSRWMKLLLLRIILSSFDSSITDLTAASNYILNVVRKPQIYCFTKESKHQSRALANFVSLQFHSANLLGHSTDFASPRKLQNSLVCFDNSGKLL